MGRPKLLLPWGKGTVLEAALENLLGAPVLEVIVVLGPRASEIAPLMAKGERVKVVLNQAFASGMASSIRKGLEALDPRAEGIMIALGDMPFIPPEVIRRLVEAFRTSDCSIVVPTFRGRRGHPVVFDRRYEAELRRLQGDEGGRAIVASHLEEVLEVELDCPGVLQDIDTLQEYFRYRPR